MINSNTESLVQEEDWIFGPLEEVLPERIRVVEGPRPTFGEDEVWDLTAIGRTPSFTARVSRIRFHDLSGNWGLIARTMIMAELNPVHPELRARGVFSSSKVPKIQTLAARMVGFRELSRIAAGLGLSSDLGKWGDKDVIAILEEVAKSEKPYRAELIHKVLQILKRLAPAFTSGLSATVPEKMSSKAFLELRTQPLTPDDFWTMIKASWLYIDKFSEDIFKARAFMDSLTSSETARTKYSMGERDAAIADWLNDPTNRIPLNCYSNRGEIHWTGLTLLAAPDGKEPNGYKVSARNKELVRQKIEAGHPTQWGFYPEAVAFIENTEGVRGPWIEGFDRTTLLREAARLQTACAIFILMMTTMRRSEALAIRRDCLGFREGHSVIKSKIFKHRDPLGEPASWWIIPPVQKAVEVAQKLCGESDFLFVSKGGDNLINNQRIDGFIANVNQNSFAWGLDEISESHITPHRFRKTMAIMTAREPLGEIANGFNLGHNGSLAVSSGLTTAYGAPTQAWSELFELERARVLATELVSDWSAERKGELKVTGPGAVEYRSRLNKVGEQASFHLMRGDDRLLRKMLRDGLSGFRFGTIAHCMGDVDKAKCLEGVVDEARKKGPISALCKPLTCANSAVTDYHLEIWKSEEDELIKLLSDRKMAKHHKLRLQNELREVREILAGIEVDEEG